MAYNADLRGDNAMVADSSRAGDSDLSDEKAMCAYLRAVADIDDVAEFAALTDNCIFNRAALNAAVCADFDIVFDNNHADLRDFIMFAIVGCVTVAVFADCGVGVYDYVVSQSAAVVYHGVWVQDAVVADFDAVADKHARINYHVVADYGIVANRRAVVNDAGLADFGGFGDVCLGRNADVLMLSVAVKKNYYL